MTLALLVCALFLRVVVPQGWMPVETGGGWQMMLCSGTGPMTMPGMPMARAPTGTHPQPGTPDHGAGEHACVFSGLAMASDVPPPALIELPKPALEPWVAAFGIIVAIGRGLAAPPPPPTGPPSA